jgi:hypothetical protein
MMQADGLVQEWAHVPSSRGGEGDPVRPWRCNARQVHVCRFDLRHHMPQSSTSNRHMRTCSGTTSIVLRSHSAESWLAATSASMFAR